MESEAKNSATDAAAPPVVTSLEQTALPLESPISRYGLRTFLYLLVASLLVMSLPDHFGGSEKVLFSLVVSALLIVGCAIVWKSPASTAVALGLGIAALLSRWGAHIWGEPMHHIADAVISVSFLIFFLIVVIKQVFERGKVTRSKIEGAAVIYLLLGIIWGRVYTLIELVSPGAFHFPEVPNGVFGLYRYITYYSFMTLTTTGYGDVIPVHPLTRGLAVLESCVGIFFPSILLARLVSLEITQSSGER